MALEQLPPPHPPLEGYTVHCIAGFCQCRCEDCYSRLLGCCWCLNCVCEDSYDDRHNRMELFNSMIGNMLTISYFYWLRKSQKAES